MTNDLIFLFYFSTKPAGIKSYARAAFALAPLDTFLRLSGTPVLFSILLYLLVSAMEQNKSH